MKKILLMLVAGVLFTSVSMASESYKLNDDQVDLLFKGATEIAIAGVNSSDFNLNNMGTTFSSADDKMLIAFIVCWFLGGFGIHRYVLGTKPSMWAIYTFTCFGIFGIVPFIDWVVLLVNGLIQKQGDKYLSNEKFFMWA